MAVSYLPPRRPVLRVGPVKCCPSCKTRLVGGPVVFYCEPCRRSVQAAEVPNEITFSAADRPRAAA